MPSDTGSTLPASFFGGYRFALGCLGGVNGSNPWKLIIVGATISVYGDDIFGHASSEGGFVFTFTYFLFPRANDGFRVFGRTLVV